MKTIKVAANIAHPSNNSKGICENHAHGHADDPHYLEPHNKTHSQNSTFYSEKLKMHVPQCIQGYGNFVCEPCQVTFFRALLCAKEWCPVCGEKESWVHQRTYMRWWEKWEQLPVLGYLVVTVPWELRNHIKSLEAADSKKVPNRKAAGSKKVPNRKAADSKEVLNRIRNYWWRKLAAEFDGYKDLCRWHWAGEDGKEFAPHLNILFNHGYIDKSILNRWRSDYYIWIKRTFNITVGAGTTVIHYSYHTNRNERIHKLKYVTRATMRVYNPAIARIIHNYRNCVSHGKFDKPKTNKKELASLEACRCPVCQTKLTYIEFIRPDKVYALSGKLDELDGGWFRHNLLDRGG